MGETTSVKPEYKQISNYVGTAALGAATFLVAHQDIITAVVPPPWNAVAAALLSAIGGALIAYREKKTVPTTGVST